MTTLGFLIWARVFIPLLTVPDPTGRTVIWAWELLGKFYKSRLTNYLKRMHGAMTTSGSMEEKNIGNQMTNCVSLRGHGPKLIIIDKPRDGKPVNWEMIENLKNGMVLSRVSCRRARSLLCSASVLCPASVPSSLVFFPVPQFSFPRFSCPPAYFPLFHRPCLPVLFSFCRAGGKRQVEGVRR